MTNTTKTKNGDGIFKRASSKFLQMSFTDETGQRHRVSTGTNDVKLARTILAKNRIEIAEGRWLNLDNAKKHTLTQALNNFLEGKEKTKSYKNMLTYSKHIRAFFDDVTLDRLTAERVNAYVKDRLKIVSVQTLHHELNCLSAALKLAKINGWCNHNAVDDIKRPTLDNERLVYLSEDAEKTLLEKAAKHNLINSQLFDIIVFALNTGFRMSEILSVKWTDINMQKRIISVLQGKTGRFKTLPITDALFAVLSAKQKVTNISNLVFCTETGNKVSAPNLRREFYKVLAESGITNFHFHDLRHTFASRLVQNGVDIYTVAKLLGHKDLKSTQRYAHLDTAALTKSMAVLNTPVTHICHNLSYNTDNASSM